MYIIYIVVGSQRWDSADLGRVRIIFRNVESGPHFVTGLTPPPPLLDFELLNRANKVDRSRSLRGCNDKTL